MEVKKSKKADLESKKSTWLLVGFVTVLACMFVAFEWSKHDREIDLTGYLTNDIFEDIMIPITFPDQPEPPKPPEHNAIETINVVDDGDDVEEGSLDTSEADPNVGVVVHYVPIEVKPEVIDIIETHDWVEIMPQFPGGQNALNAYMSKNIKYPVVPQEQGIQGRVIVQFIVDRDGSIVEPRVVRSVDPYLDKEAVRVITSMPKWQPGIQGGKHVRVKYTVPVVFKLQ